MANYPRPSKQSSNRSTSHNTIDLWCATWFSFASFRIQLIRSQLCIFKTNRVWIQRRLWSACRTGHSPSLLKLVLHVPSFSVYMCEQHAKLGDWRRIWSRLIWVQLILSNWKLNWIFIWIPVFFRRCAVHFLNVIAKRRRDVDKIIIISTPETTQYVLH